MLACRKVSEGPFWSCGFFCLVLPWLDVKSLGQGLECQVKYWLYIDVLISGVQRETPYSSWLQLLEPTFGKLKQRWQSFKAPTLLCDVFNLHEEIFSNRRQPPNVSQIVLISCTKLSGTSLLANKTSSGSAIINHLPKQDKDKDSPGNLICCWDTSSSCYTERPLRQARHLRLSLADLLYCDMKRMKKFFISWLSLKNPQSCDSGPAAVCAASGNLSWVHRHGAEWMIYGRPCSRLVSVNSLKYHSLFTTT